MIQLTRINGTELWLNPLLIESLEMTPDTIVTLQNGHKYVVKESPEGIRNLVVTYLQQIGLVAYDSRKGNSE